MKIPKNKKWLALPLSLLLAATASVQSTIAYIVAQTQPAFNTFKPFDSIEGGLVISKTIDHPYGELYDVPENITFDFQVDLGAIYAGYTVKTSEGEIVADQNGSIVVNVKPNVPFGIEGIDEGMPVTITELSSGGGFSVQGDSVRSTVISPDDFVAVEFVNVYEPTPAALDLTLTGLKRLEGREWQEGDTFEFLLEEQKPGGEWTAIGTRSVVYTPDDENFASFDFSDITKNITCDQLGDYAYRLTEVPGSMEGITYDDRAYLLTFTVSDDTMDGKMDIGNVGSTISAATLSKDGAIAYHAAFKNLYAEATTTESTTTTTETTTSVTTSDTSDTTTETTTSGTSDTTTETTTSSTTTTEITTSDTTTTETTTSSTTTTDTTTTETTTSSATTSDTTTSETTETTETTTESTTTEPIPGSATWSIGMVEGAPGETVRVPVTITGDTGLYSYLFNIISGELPWDSYEFGDAYPGFEFVFDPETGAFGGTAPQLADVTAADGSVVLWFNYVIPEDAANGTVYNIEFAGDVEAYDADGVLMNIIEENGWIKVVDPEVKAIGTEYEIEGQYQFYFSHDPREFDPVDLVASITRYTLYDDGTRGEAEPLTDFSIVSFNGQTPEGVFQDTDGAYFVGKLPATITDEFGVHEFPEVGTAYIAVKGDVTLTGEADAIDAAAILVYAAKYGAGLEAYIYSDTELIMEDFAYFLGDVTGESEDHGITDSLGNETSHLDAIDSAAILVYAAKVGAGVEADWAKILSPPLPKYTAAIDAARKAMQEIPTE